MTSGKLYIVATPIGNLGDITLRAIETLKNADLILCEDTRVTKNLLEHYEISKPLISYHQHTEGKKIKEIIGMLEDGKNLALVTDAGTPGISDPGGLLIKQIVSFSKLVEVVPIPGASAIVAALSISGFPTDKFVFMGFPPHKNKRQKYFKEVSACEFMVVFYESGHRIKKCLQELKEVLDAKRQVMICREVTKKFETIYRGTIGEVSEVMQDERGEFVVVINSR
ncbi:MAG: 16S rRNA (cytidine(1402)-2'-O)-methyltransferase [Candidatus Magasanikbacteria bacterium RIFOXYD2_FULL_39_9]|uniref:Ribosomal RNA small subunit methyltransferase I n=1 Tax=Candidatus Magasanikbacteria bacterium RIFOXYD1_FULL_40_23 TaxID=1798705 RepID=A0A1F6PAZ1_9BACT|nr:MAG: 16S rRNA (cytidine(1402)-2'-O)-methyltransferase [Candidatus Magasanikbacteria bacterium RIFOXYD2_FULL_39_9]OGH93341.1 MAG: 16S rRNA (cytidine(1402)-2'-O)-methyltransferase [Candidatus Magasanikbacteria bacterium RIFOXYD1_FULL_40_23]